MESDTQKIERSSERNCKTCRLFWNSKKHHWETNSLPNSVKQLAQITNPKYTFIEERLKEVDTIQEVQHATEEHDPNGLLNKQGGYTASIYFQIVK